MSVRTWLLGVSAISLLACSGMTETLLGAAGVDIEISEDGSVTIDGPDGKMSIHQLDGPPDDWRMPVPDCVPDAGQFMRMEGVVSSTTVTYECSGTTDKVIPQFRAWFQDNGLEPADPGGVLGGSVTDLSAVDGTTRYSAQVLSMIGMRQVNLSVMTTPMPDDP